MFEERKASVRKSGGADADLVQRKKAYGDICVAMLGARMHYALPRLLYQAGLLGRFYTDNYIGNKPWLERILKLVPARLRPPALVRLLGRNDSVIPASLVRSFDRLGFLFAWRLSRVRDKNDLVEVVAERASAFNVKIINSLVERPRLVWGFSGAALELFQWARPRGIRCILEQMIVPREIEVRLLDEELARWPDWEPALMPFAAGDVRAKRERMEWELADRIVGGSQFVIDGLEHCGADVTRCRVVPYGVDPGVYLSREPGPAGEFERRALRVLFVGEVGLRKGTPYLLAALKMLGPAAIDARFVGTVALRQSVVKQYTDVATFVGTVPRSELPAIYNWADVLCLPSICEGSATVTYEALASGVPVIATRNAGSPVQEGTNGFVVPIRDPVAIADRLDRYRSDRTLLENHARGAALLQESISLEAYGRRLMSVVEELT